MMVRVALNPHELARTEVVSSKKRKLSDFRFRLRVGIFGISDLQIVVEPYFVNFALAAFSRLLFVLFRRLVEPRFRFILDWRLHARRAHLFAVLIVFDKKAFAILERRRDVIRHHRIALGVPRKDAAPVGRNQPFGGERTAGCEQSVRFDQCLLDRWKIRCVGEPADHHASCRCRLPG